MSQERRGTVAFMSWVTLVFTNLLAGATGAVITTHGTQSRARRDARGQVRTCLQHVETLARQPGVSPSDLASSVAQVEDAAFIAAVPRRVIAIYRDARLAADDAERNWAEPARQHRYPDKHITRDAERKARELLVRVLWHPWLTMPTRGLRTWQLRRFLNSGAREPRVYERGMTLRQER